MSWSFTEDQIRAAFPMSPWEHQLRSVKGTADMLNRVASMTLCLPTGAGKTNCAAALLNLASSAGLRSMMYSDRKMLTEQLSDSLAKFGIDHGVRAASLPGRVDLGKNVQIGSIQTELARTEKNSFWSAHEADLYIYDEGHKHTSGYSLETIQRAVARGAKVVLLTGSPLGMSHITPNLFVGATNSELRACKAHVPAIVKCINEFDTSNVVRKKVGIDAGEYSEKSAKEWFHKCQQIVGIVYNDWVRFNPIGKMTLGVAPGSEEALSMAEEFYRHGTTAAAITAKGLWANGKEYKDDAQGKTRKMIDEDWQAGDIKVMWHRFVYREAIDRPGLFHMILATPIGTLRSYLQTVGRAIRWSPATPDFVIIQDHAGNFWQHGSPNEDRDWNELYWMDEAQIREKQKAKRREESERGEEPICCPRCGTALRFGTCPPAPRGCGESLAVTNPGRMRKVIQMDGRVVEVENITRLGEEPKKRKASTKSIEQKQWDSIFWAARKSTSARPMTFNQAMAIYMKKFGDRPPRNLKNMPRDPADFGRKIRAIDFSSLN